MRGNLEKSGHYELIETTKGHQILNLNDNDFYAIVEGQKGDLIVRSDSDHEKKKLIRQGKFYFADFDDDPEFNDIPHLFLQDSGGRYREWILPKGVPSKGDHQKKLVRSGTLIDKDKVEYHTEGEGSKGREKKYKGTEHHAKSKSEAAGHTSGANRKGSSGREALESKRKNELYDLAKKKEIEGRSKMDRSALIDALGKA